VVTAKSARRALDSACEDLDTAVRALPEGGEDQVLASPELLALLLRVVAARRQLAEIDSPLAGLMGNRR
jgi:hypothetical protein